MRFGVLLNMGAALRVSFRDGDHPHVLQAPARHLGPDGRPLESLRIFGDHVIPQLTR
ncbi:hypothetical protein ACNUDN_06995 [Mycobacterium sp. smrl_JER01]|uniref:hypothetical protein n=1 Tax=Mycobacterium sp. smrl_JER01 TaxID=3402633 RepID=UPI003AC32B88